MLRNWRAWVLLVLFAGPLLGYVALGALWLGQHEGPFGLPGELLYEATTVWIVSGIAFAVLASRWTRAKTTLLPPLDWDAPSTFNQRDRQGWEIVQEEAERGDTINLVALTRFDTYLDSGRRLARCLAAHYQPEATDPIEHVPVVDLLTALQLAAEDLVALCRQVPGGDLITPAHWNKAVVAAGYLAKANEIYSFLLPLFQPVAGLARLGTQKLMVQPAWRDMQQNLLRWFYRAYVNRLGMHLIELYSGRLAIGAEQYRRLTRKGVRGAVGSEPARPLTLGVIGLEGAGKSRLIKAMDQARTGPLESVRTRLGELGLDPALAQQLRTASLAELPSYPSGAPASRRERRALSDAVTAAVKADLLILVVDLRREDFQPETRFVEAWEEWYASHPEREIPPIIVVLTHADTPETPAGAVNPPPNGSEGARSREVALRGHLDRLRGALPPTVTTFVPVALDEETRGAMVVSEQLLPELAVWLHRAERSSILRQLHEVASQSKARRLVAQLGRQGLSLWETLRTRRSDGGSPRS